MVRRIRIDPANGYFDVSPSGLDVFSATVQQLAFTARGGGYHGLFTAGVVDSTAISWSGSASPGYYGLSGNFYYDLMYPGGKVFSDPPDFVCFYNDYRFGTGVDWWTPNFTYDNTYFDATAGGTVGSGTFVKGVALPDRMRWTLSQAAFTASPPPVPRYFSYVVFEQ